MWQALPWILAGASSAVASSPDAWSWATDFASPQPLVSVSSPLEAELLARCGRGDEALRAVASKLVRRALSGLPPLDAPALADALRVEGEPHAWPRSWVAAGPLSGRAESLRQLAAWGATREQGDRRCGVATGSGADGSEVLAVVAVDALADLAPLPVQVHVGSWLTVDARLLVPTEGARVIVMGPSGAPRSVPARFDGDRVLARLTLDRPGAFTVQVVADLPSGPRPVLEAILFGDEPPWPGPPDVAVPGEDVSLDLLATPADNLFAKLAAVRAAEQLPPLQRDARLDAAALAHATRMRAVGSLAHDAGDGDPVRRLESAGVGGRVIGENIARAASLRLAHRALYASPSHRANLLSTRFARVGVGVAVDADGSVWAVEEFSAR